MAYSLVIPTHFQLLVNDGFLLDQGVHTLEAVQKFYEEILEIPERAEFVETELIEFCQMKNHKFQPIVTLMLKNEKGDEEYYHAVTPEDSFLHETQLMVNFI